MTFDELYEYGMKSSPAKVCIPQELVQSLPRLERINGRIVVQYWYYYRNVSYPWQIDDPLYYAAFDIYEDKLVEMKALSHHTFGQSWLDLLFWSREMREVKYLEHCVTGEGYFYRALLSLRDPSGSGSEADQPRNGGSQPVSFENLEQRAAETPASEDGRL